MLSPRRDVFPDRRCHQASVTSEAFIRADEIPVGPPQMVERVTGPLYRAFDFFSPSSTMVS
jgi:hypothetical protein